MRVEHLSLRQFRNYEALEQDFVPGVNLIVGDNAQGKTNLLEAIVYLSRGHSFRTRREQELIRFEQAFAELKGTVDAYDRGQEIRVLLFAGRKPRQLFLNGVKQRTAAELAGKLYTVLFCPEDLLVLKGGAAARRRLLDNAICQLRPAYEQALAEYTRLLERKNKILKARFEQPSLLQVLPEYNERMAQTGAVLIWHRAAYLAKLQTYAGQFHRECSHGIEHLRLQYRTVSTVEDPAASKRELYERLRQHQRTHETAELESAQCLSGPHRDDFDVLLQDRAMKQYGSQGQTRTAAIAIKLAERELLRQDTGQEPVLLLDDVLSELDPDRQDFLLNKLCTGQVFITCCERQRVTSRGQVLTIENGHVL